MSYIERQKSTGTRVKSTDINQNDPHDSQNNQHEKHDSQLNQHDRQKKPTRADIVATTKKSHY